MCIVHCVCVSFCKLSLGILFLCCIFEFKKKLHITHISMMSLLSLPKTFALKHIFLVVDVIDNVKVVTINLE
jgi:hypothetical protein